MDDDIKNPPENQPAEVDEPPKNIYQNDPKPIFETVPQEEEQKPPVENLQPEETPENLTPENIETPPASPPPQHHDDTPFSEDRKKYIFIIGGILVFLIFFIFILRFFFSRSAEKKEAKLIYWGLWEDKEVIQPLITQYEQQHSNIKIDYIKMSEQQYREKLLARSKNQSADRPDIFRYHNTWIPEIKDVISPLPKSIMSNQDFEGTFYPVQAKDLKVGDDYYGIPLTIDGLVLVYNEDLFKRAGIAGPPVTWENVIDDIAKLTVKNKDDSIVTSGIALGTATNVDHFSDIFGLFLVQNGGSIDQLDQKEAADALQAYRKFAEPPDNFWSEDLPNSVLAFTQEKVGMIIVPSWEIFFIKNANPEINLKSVSVPVIPGSKPISIATYWVEGVSKYSQNQIEAWKFLKFLSEKENMTKMYESEAKTRLFGEPYSRKDLGPLLADNPFIGAVIKQADSFVSIPMISRTFDNGLNDDIVKYIENAINSTAQGVDYEAALSTAHEGVQQVLSQFK